MGTGACPAADTSKQDICWTYLCCVVFWLEGNVTDVRKGQLWGGYAYSLKRYSE